MQEIKPTNCNGKYSNRVSHSQNGLGEIADVSTVVADIHSLSHPPVK